LDFPKTGQGGGLVPETKKDFTHTNECIFVSGIEGESLVEGPSPPGELLPGQTGVPQAYIQLDRVRIDRKALSKHFEGPIVISIVV
jgi:hypothetical protein